jgi:antibiotic biosynthesis monooxygenase (ABM) superfamily enzyme
MLLKLRTHVMTYPGFISAENLISTQDASVFIMISTWKEPDDWFLWETSKIRKAILQENKAILLEEPRITVYRPMPTIKWVG